MERLEKAPRNWALLPFVMRDRERGREGGERVTHTHTHMQTQIQVCISAAVSFLVDREIVLH